MKLTIENQYGAFMWDISYGGAPSDIAKLAFGAAGLHYRDPICVPNPLPDEAFLEGDLGTCPKCGGEANPEWHKHGRVADMDGDLELGEFGAPVGATGIRFVVVRECLRWDCDCGYSWLGPIAGGSLE